MKIPLEVQAQAVRDAMTAVLPRGKDAPALFAAAETLEWVRENRELLKAFLAFKKRAPELVAVTSEFPGATVELRPSA